MKIKLIIISIILLLVMVFASGCIPVLEKLGLVSPTGEEQLTPEKGGPPDGLVKVLIGFKEKPGAAQQAMVQGVGGKIKYTYHIVDAIAASIPEKAIDALQNNPNVKYVEPDVEIFAVGQTLPWGVNRIDAEVVWTNYTGKGVDVAIIDSGIDKDHLDLKDNIIDGENFVSMPSWKTPDPDKWDDDYGHGTHVAGIVAALDNAIGVVGVAPEANLYALKVLDKTGRGNYSDVISALQWCEDNSIQITNNSYGSSGDPGVIVKKAFDDSAMAGILHVAAAGNENGGSVIYPAAYDSVIAVSATDSDDKLASFSSVGNEVELAAPGVYIYSTYKDGGYATYSGTSMASPHVAGTAALVIAAEISDVRTQLQDTADDLGVSGKDDMYGYGLVNAAKAVGVDTDTTPPAKVTGLTVTSVSCVQLDLVWNDNTETDLNHYNVYRSTTSGGSYDLIASVSAPTTSYSDTGLTASTTYYYVVSAVDTSGNEGEKSVEASGTTSTDDLGPVTSNVVADPNPTNGATSVTLTADVSDATTGNSTIAAAEYFVGTVDTGGSGTTMNASDGTFNSPTEGVTATMDVSGWAVGQYTLHVHGKDIVGNWGETESVVLEVTEAPSDTMHVFSIDMSLKKAGINVNAIAKVTIVDASGNPVEGATVSGTWSGETSDSDSGITDASGEVSLSSDKVKRPPSGTTFIFTVDDVAKAGWTYEESANEETSGSITI